MRYKYKMNINLIIRYKKEVYLLRLSQDIMDQILEISDPMKIIIYKIDIAGLINLYETNSQMYKLLNTNEVLNNLTIINNIDHNCEGFSELFYSNLCKSRNFNDSLNIAIAKYHYNLFYSLVKTPYYKKWIKEYDTKYKATNNEKLFIWISKAKDHQFTNWIINNLDYTNIKHISSIIGRQNDRNMIEDLIITGSLIFPNIIDKGWDNIYYGIALGASIINNYKIILWLEDKIPYNKSFYEGIANGASFNCHNKLIDWAIIKGADNFVEIFEVLSLNWHVKSLTAAKKIIQNWYEIIPYDNIYKMIINSKNIGNFNILNLLNYYWPQIYNDVINEVYNEYDDYYDTYDDDCKEDYDY